MTPAPGLSHIYCTHCRTIIRDGVGVRGPKGGQYCTVGCMEWLSAKGKRAHRGGRLPRHQREDVKAWLLRGSGGLCPVCCRPLALKDAVLDHDHALDADDPRSWRGATCGTCNSGIGKLSDEMPGVLGAVIYLASGERFWFLPR